MTPNDPVAHARLDAEGRPLSIDGRLASLNSAAGGGAGVPLAIPALAGVARLSRRLGIVIARPVRVADGEEDVELWVRARPVGDGVEIEVSGWRLHDVVAPPAGGEAARAFDVADADFTFETDAGMTLTALSGEPVSIGHPMTKIFDFSVGDGLVQVLAATANRGAFADQPARLVPGARDVLLSGQARIDVAGEFAGLAGSGRFVEPLADAPAMSNAAFGDRFATRLDRALRTPLQRIVANADSIGAQTDGPIRPEYIDYAHDIASAARHLMGLVDDLVDLSAIERPDFTVAAEAIDLADVARRAAGLLAVRAGNADVRIERPASGDTLPAIGEFRRALQILVNLIGNAVRYSPRGASVSVVGERGDGSAAIIVADEGRGIAMDDQARIFDKFGRVDPSEPGGNGLGLYIARRLARAMGGDITVESEAGQGARFTLTLPAP